MLWFLHFSYSSNLLDIEPFEKLFLSVGLMFVSLYSSLILVSVFIFIFVSVLIIGVGFPLVSFIRLFILSYGFIFLGIFPVVFEFGVGGGDFLWSIGFGSYVVGVSLFSVKLGFHILVRVLSSLFCLYFLILTTPFSDIVILLKRFRVPLFLLELMVLLHRFFIIMLGVVVKTVRSQRSRLGYSSYRVSFRSLVLLVVSLFVNSYMGIERFFRALESRSYGGEFPLFGRDYSFSIFRVLAICCLLFFLILFDFSFSV